MTVYLKNKLILMQHELVSDAPSGLDLRTINNCHILTLSVENKKHEAVYFLHDIFYTN